MLGRGFFCCFSELGSLAAISFGSASDVLSFGVFVFSMCKVGGTSFVQKILFLANVYISF